jgi:hypothetical protein
MNEMLLPFAPLVLKLLQGVVYQDDKLWEQLLADAVPIGRHFSDIGLRLHLDEGEGYAYLTQPVGEGNAGILPRLIRRIPLTYEATILCVLLRESLQQFDAHSPDEFRHVLSYSQIQHRMSDFLPEQNDEERLRRQISNAIGQVEKIGFLKKLNTPTDMENSYEVRRIIKAKISADELVDIRNKLKQTKE